MSSPGYRDDPDSSKGLATETNEDTPPESETRAALQRTALPHRDEERAPVEYRVYKRRFFGLFQLVLLNIIVSWDVCFRTPACS